MDGRPVLLCWRLGEPEVQFWHEVDAGYAGRRPLVAGAGRLNTRRLSQRQRLMRTWRSPDGITWVVDVDLPGSSNAMVIFRHPDGATARLDRYNWYISNSPEARSVTSRLSPAKVLESLTDDDLATAVSAVDGDLPPGSPDPIGHARTARVSS